jgi:hypothetical protein
VPDVTEATLPGPERSWLRGLGDALQLGALAMAGALLAVMLVAFGLWELSLGRVAVARIPGDPYTVVDDARVAVTHMVCVAYLMAAFVYALRAGERTLARVRPLLDSGPQMDAVLDASGDRSALRVAAAVGVGAWLATSFLGPGSVSLDPREWTAEIAWHRVLGAAIGVLGFRLGTLLVRQSSRLSRLAAQIREIALLDLDPLAPFARQGLTNALLLLGFAACYSLFLVEREYLVVAIPLWIGTAAVAAVGLLLPLKGTRDRIRRAKRSELDWCRARLRDARQTLGDASVGYTGLDELVAWESRIEEVPEWPLDASARARFALYLLIPLGSWSAAALVERGIDNLLK